MKRLMIGLWLVVMPILFASALADEGGPGFNPGPAPGSFIVGAWKLVCDTTQCQQPIVDTEFRFTNPTNLTLTLEYAFFENDGTFCGCDRDTLAPNKTTVYTASGERNSTPSLMQCKGE